MLDKTYAIVCPLVCRSAAPLYALYGRRRGGVVTNARVGDAHGAGAGWSPSRCVQTGGRAGWRRRWGWTLTVGEGAAKVTELTGIGAPLKARLMRTGLGAGALLTPLKVPPAVFMYRSSRSFLTLTVSVIFPSACYLRMFEDELTDNERVANWAIMLLSAGSASSPARHPRSTPRWTSSERR